MMIRAHKHENKTEEDSLPNRKTTSRMLVASQWNTQELCKPIGSRSFDFRIVGEPLLSPMEPVLHKHWPSKKRQTRSPPPGLWRTALVGWEESDAAGNRMERRRPREDLLRKAALVFPLLVGGGSAGDALGRWLRRLARLGMPPGGGCCAGNSRNWWRRSCRGDQKGG